MNNEITEERWKVGRLTEDRFWRHKLPKLNASFNHPFQLYDYFAPMIGDKKEVKIADIGAGAMATIGSTWPGVKVEVFSSDEMAKEYEQMCIDLGIKRLFPVVYENMEGLSYPSNTFDIVNCVNAIDHVVRPYLAIMEMVRVCKPGGWVYLRHMREVGRTSGYSGLHQWNINFVGGECLFWNKLDHFLIRDYIPGFVSEVKQELPNESYRIVSKYRKPL
jgi:ubiquinone/menaquinone biosynthesis C-methylase UbiE